MLFLPLISIGQLVERKPVFGYPELIVLFSGVLFIGVARLSNDKTMSIVWSIFSNFKVEIKFSDSIKLHPLGSFSLLLNFIASSSLLIFLATKNIFDSSINHYLFSISIALVIFLVHYIGLYLVGLITGSTKQLNLGILYNVNFMHTSGVVCLILSIPWLLNSDKSLLFLFSSIIMIGILYVVRLIKLFTVGFRENIPLYYIILYLCTLEIYPIYMFVRVYDKFFKF